MKARITVPTPWLEASERTKTITLNAETIGEERWLAALARAVLEGTAITLDVNGTETRFTFLIKAGDVEMLHFPAPVPQPERDR